jgi:hypothetical protein
VEDLVLSDVLIAAHRTAYLDGLIDHPLGEAEIEGLRDLTGPGGGLSLP